MNTVSFELRGDEVAISFRYDSELVEAARELPRRRFDPDTKEWLVPAHRCREALTAFEAVRCLVHVEPEVEAILMDQPETPHRTVRVFQEGEEYVVDFPYDERVVRAVRSIPGRRFDGERKLWLVEIRDPAKTLREIVRQLRFAQCEVSVDKRLRRLLAP